MDRQRIIATWLLAVAAMVFAMVVIGGLTRLTGSGLSIVEWRPLTGVLPPFGDAEWQATFDAYKQFPEFREVNQGMDLAGFKSIFWLEFIHRLWGRMIGLVFFVPLVVFIVKGWVQGRLGLHLVGIFLLGGLQGGIGWYMVKSGLVDRHDVSQYRLTLHLSAAIVVYGYMLWVALGLLFPEPKAAGAGLAGLAKGLAGWVFLTMLSGGFVAGLDAGLGYNTFPLMNGQFFPDDLFTLHPWWLSPFEDATTVQFDHRVLAEFTVALVLAFWWRARKAALPHRARLALDAMAAMVLIQAALGIATLLLSVPIALASAHQAGAVVLFTTALWTAHELRRT